MFDRRDDSMSPMRHELQVLVPRFVDASNTNAQNLNAKALLSRFRSSRARWTTLHYHEPDRSVAESPRVDTRKLWRTRLWQHHAVLQYQQPADAIFYPGMDWYDLRGLQLRKLTGRRVPVIGILEGLVGDAEREKLLEGIVGHRVYCHGREASPRIDGILHACDHIIALSPMLAGIGSRLYGDRFSVLRLGIDTDVFHSRGRKTPGKFRVMSVGTLTDKKRPQSFLELAARCPSAEFAWYGQGPLLDPMRAAAKNAGMQNLAFAGPLPPQQLAEEYRRSDLFVLPSFSEGAPKVLQEAAACGLPRVAFGFYEPPLRDGLDGYIVWTDEQMQARVLELAAAPARAREMGSRAAADSARSDWEIVAPLWEQTILDLVENLRRN